MREILFRGKRLDNGEWVYGFPIFYSQGTVVMCREFLRNENVNPETVGQYTGLDDKNGRKIFEGDLVKLDGWTPPAMQISFIEGAFCLADADEVGEYCGDIHYIHHAGINQTTVVGNIYDNPELIRGAE